MNNDINVDAKAVRDKRDAARQNDDDRVGSDDLRRVHFSQRQSTSKTAILRTSVSTRTNRILKAPIIVSKYSPSKGFANDDFVADQGTLLSS
jgi:hypothetical protein